MNDVAKNEVPLSESSVSLNLSLIQERCSELMIQDGLDLSLEDGSCSVERDNPYNRAFLRSTTP